MLQDQDTVLSLDDFCRLLPSQGRLLGLDVGQARIGLALSDPGRMIATPYGLIQRGKFRQFLVAVETVVKAQQVCGVIVGLPLLLSGGDSAQTQGVRAFAANMAAGQTLPVTVWDERWSSAIAHQVMRGAGMSRGRQAANVDKMAASYMLQGFLDRARNL